MKPESAFRLCFCVALVGVSAVARAEIYKCVDDSGHVTYSNIAQKGCQRLNLEPLPTIPAPAKPSAAAKPSASPGSFPRVEGDVQKKRDADRRRIIEDELASEERLLDEARKSLTEQEGTVEPGERNVAQRCQQVCAPGKDGKLSCKQVCTAVPPGINLEKVETRLQPLRDRVALHERNIEALKKELANIR